VLPVFIFWEHHAAIVANAAKMIKVATNAAAENANASLN